MRWLDTNVKAGVRWVDIMLGNWNKIRVIFSGASKTQKEEKMREFKISPLLLLVSITCMLMGSATAQEVPKEVFERGVFFSTEEDFVTRGPLPPGGPIISDGDLLNSAGYVYMRNSELLSVFNVDFDLGLDAADVINVEDRFVIFSTELDHPRGMFTAGDLLATNGAIVPNAALLAAFDIPRGLDLGLDAVHFKGEREDVIRFLDRVKEEGREFLMENPRVLMERLKEFSVDIWFSTEGTAPFPNAPGFLDGDLLSAATGTIVLSNFDALPLAVPAGIPDRGVDFGMDAVAILSDPIEQIELLLYSTEINGLLPAFTDGDALLRGDGVVFHNISLISAFEPKVKDLGLDALSIGLPPLEQCKFTSVGGVAITSTTWDFATGYVDPPGRPDPGGIGLKDHSFGNEVSIRGIISDEVVEHRVLFRPEGGGDSPILMPLPPELFWRVIPLWSLATDGDGWMNTALWKWVRNNYCPDLVLVDWNTAGIAYGKYILCLECKDANGNTKICEELPVQIDNTVPVPLLSNELECQIFGPNDMPLTIRGMITDAGSNFYAYSLRVFTFPYPPIQFKPPYYYYEPAPPPMDDSGTVGPNPLLGQLNIPAVYGDKTKAGRYTVFLYAYDRSLRGWFNPDGNNVTDAFQGALSHRNWTWTATNFEFHP